MIIKYEDYLMHHGIEGQKWGVKNGPPYPLDASDHSPAEKRAEKSSTKESKKFELSDNQKKALKIGAIAAGTALVAIGGYKLYKSDIIKKSNIGKDILNSVSSNKFNKIVRSEDVKTRLKKCNPKYDSTGITAHFNMNCGNTILANEGRNRGLDVTAKGNPYGMTISELMTNFKGYTKNNFCEINIPDSFSNNLFDNSTSKQIKNKIQESISSQYPNGSRGALFFTSYQGSHWMSWEKSNGKISFENPQNPSLNIDNYFGTFYSFEGNPPTAIRLDNLDFSDTIGNMIQNSKKKITKFSNFDTDIGNEILRLGKNDDFKKKFDLTHSQI